MNKITLMLAEDHALFRNMLANAIVDETDEIEIIGLAANGSELLQLIQQRQPAVVLLDLRMPVLGGNEVLKILATTYPNIKTIVLSSNYSDYYVAQVAISGARAFLDKSAAIQDVIKAIKSVHKDGFYFNKIINKEILDSLNSARKLYYLIDNKKLSEREIEVLKEICNNSTPEQIADNLSISVNTVQFHKNNLKKKTESDSIVALVKYAIKHGIINLPE